MAGRQFVSQLLVDNIQHTILRVGRRLALPLRQKPH
jgi:hypothetical protein